MLLSELTAKIREIENAKVYLPDELIAEIKERHSNMLELFQALDDGKIGEVIERLARDTMGQYLLIKVLEIPDVVVRSNLYAKYKNMRDLGDYDDAVKKLKIEEEKKL